MKKVSLGFTLLEVIVIIVIIGIMVTSFIPRLVRRPVSSDWKTILDDFNNLITFARQEAISHQKICRLFFKTKSDGSALVVVQKEQVDSENSSRKIFKDIHSEYFPTQYSLSEYVKIESLYYGKDNLLDNPGEHGPCCYVIPDGLVQDFLIRCKRIYNGREAKASFKMNPFLGKFDLLYGYVRPGG